LKRLAGVGGLEPTTLGFGVRFVPLKTNNLLSNRGKITH
jgi:hypothetical protein